MSRVTVSVATAHNQLSRLIDQAESGYDVVISRRGKPVARLQPVSESPSGGNGAAALAVVREARRARRNWTTHEEIRERVAAEKAAWDR
ncbi:MAG: type II toxin-antitoxin system prevent-host-death family antitoxin [Bifidobacteriaceae bacterium]|jgi:prevent-host-death family protein|nr:type II toxin-antitoxin system prevent-host-death family antitoxin [Bifidobacteriaceae bacterium]